MINRKARGFVMIMVVIAIFSLLLRVAIDKIIKINITQNESNAQATLKLISAALENYAQDHIGEYPNNFTLLVEDNPSYLDRDYLRESPLKGYAYSCSTLEVSGYSCSAVPLNCNLVGRTSYTVTTGGLIISEACVKKE